MRLLTHNTLRNNSAEAKGKGFPLRITATEIRVEENNEEVTEQQLEFVKNMLSRIDWPALVKVSGVTCQEGIHSILGYAIFLYSSSFILLLPLYY